MLIHGYTVLSGKRIHTKIIISLLDKFKRKFKITVIV